MKRKTKVGILTLLLIAIFVIQIVIGSSWPHVLFCGLCAAFSAFLYSATNWGNS